MLAQAEMPGIGQMSPVVLGVFLDQILHNPVRFFRFLQPFVGLGLADKAAHAMLLECDGFLVGGDGLLVVAPGDAAERVQFLQFR